MVGKPQQPASRRYDKGERRYKHVGSGALPEIVFDPTAPRRWVGKCPSTVKSQDMIQLLQEAIAGSNGDRSLLFPKKLYVVHDGTIYEAQTTDQGKSYHAYPYHGKLRKSLLADLRSMAVAKRVEKEFDSA